MLLASVVGQDLVVGVLWVFRIARRVAKDRVISTVDPDARHGHKTSARGFDGYKGHVSVDPDSELIVATAVTAGNAGDATAAGELLADDLGEQYQDQEQEQQPKESTDAGQPQAEQADSEPQAQPSKATADEPAADPEPTADPADDPEPGDGEHEPGEQPLSVYGDAAYGSGEFVNTLDQAGAEVNCKVQPPVAPGGRFSKDAFQINLKAGTVTCPAGNTVALKPAGDGQLAHFGNACAGCPLAERCTTSKQGRTVQIGPYEQQLAQARERQRDPAWKADYKATRPKVERKISHLMRRRHGGRRARVRGKPKVSADFALLAAAVNLARLAMLGLAGHDGGWQANTA